MIEPLDPHELAGKTKQEILIAVIEKVNQVINLYNRKFGQHEKTGENDNTPRARSPLDEIEG